MHSATIFFALAAVVASDASVAHIGVGVGNDIWARPAYRTSYSVNDVVTGDQKSAHEVRDGDVTKGSYSLVQPDGVLRTVNYISTPLGGFQAQVINKGVAGHPVTVGGGRGLGIGAGIGGGWGGASSVVVGLGAPVTGAVLGGAGIGGLRVVAAPAIAVGGLGLGGARSVVSGGLGLGSIAGVGQGWGAGIIG